MLIRLGQWLRGHAPCVTSSQQTLSDIVPAAVFEVDATLADSYPGTGQLLANLIAAPADSEDQAAYDFTLGATVSAEGSADPVFTGSAGDPAAYFNMSTTTSGFQLAADLGGQTAFLNNFHKATEGQTGCIAIAFRSPNWTSGSSVLFGNENNTSLHGFKLVYSRHSTQPLQSKCILTICNGSGGVVFNFPGSYIPPDKDILLVLNLSHTGGDTTATLYINGTFPRVETRAVATTTDATGVMTLCNDDSFTFIFSGTRFYWAAMFNDALSESQITDVAALLSARHERIYIDRDAIDLSAVSSLFIRALNNYAGPDDIGFEEIRVYDDGSEIFEALTPVNGAPGNSFSTISAGQYTTDSDDPTAASVDRLGDGWTATSVHWSDAPTTGGLSVFVKPSAAIDLTRISARLRNPSLFTQDIRDIMFLDGNNNYIYPATSPSGLGDTDSTLPSPNTVSYTWTFL